MGQDKYTYPIYARGERIADASLHTIGVLGALAGAATMMLSSLEHLTSEQTMALGVYTFGLVSTFLASAFYHLTPWERLRPTLHRIDHAAIYLMIAATYTPLVVFLGTPFAFSILALVWGLALIGMIHKIWFWDHTNQFSTWLYLAMGWLSVALIWPIIPILPTSATILMAIGGALYTVGVVFFTWNKLKYSLAIWHGFVITASACFYFAISLGANAATG